MGLIENRLRVLRALRMAAVEEDKFRRSQLKVVRRGRVETPEFHENEDAGLEVSHG